MLEKHQLKPLSDAVIDVWKNVNFAKVNGLDVRLRVIAAPVVPDYGQDYGPLTTARGLI